MFLTTCPRCRTCSSRQGCSRERSASTSRPSCRPASRRRRFGRDEESLDFALQTVKHALLERLSHLLLESEYIMNDVRFFVATSVMPHKPPEDHCTRLLSPVEHEEKKIDVRMTTTVVAYLFLRRHPRLSSLRTSLRKRRACSIRPRGLFHGVERCCVIDSHCYFSWSPSHSSCTLTLSLASSGFASELLGGPEHSPAHLTLFWSRRSAPRELAGQGGNRTNPGFGDRCSANSTGLHSSANCKLQAVDSAINQQSNQQSAIIALLVRRCFRQSGRTCSSRAAGRFSCSRRL